MYKDIRVNKVVFISEDGLVYTRTVRRNAGPPKLDGQLQDILLLEGREELIRIAKLYFHGFIKKITKPS